MGRLNNVEFLTKIESLLSENNGKKSVYLTQKRLVTEDIEDKPKPKSIIGAAKDTQKYPLLIRLAMNGSAKGDKSDKIKVSTVVEVENSAKFWADYITIVKSGFVGLKKKEKKRNRNKVTK